MKSDKQLRRCSFCMYYPTCDHSAEYALCGKYVDSTDQRLTYWVHEGTWSACARCSSTFDDVIFNAGSPINHCPGCGRKIVEGD